MAMPVMDEAQRPVQSSPCPSATRPPSAARLLPIAQEQHRATVSPDAALCRATIALGRALGLQVVAEGVETPEQWQFLAQEHCNSIQGFIIARPMPVTEAFAFLRTTLEMPRLRSTGSHRKI